MYYSKKAGLGLAVLVCLGLGSGQAYGDLLYTITGFANNIGNPNDPSLAPEVSAGETYVAEFLIDDSAPDSDPSDGRGSYMGAILSSSITFSGGYTSMVDFSGGEVVIQQDIGGGALFLNDPNDLSTILLGDLGNPFPSDDLLEAGTTFIASPISLWSLQEPTGLIVSGSTPPGSLGPGTTGPIVLTVTNAVPEPSTAALLALGSAGFLIRRRS